jgi:hypothetical protein
MRRRLSDDEMKAVNLAGWLAVLAVLYALIRALWEG